jgi:uncharacterized protein
MSRQSPLQGIPRPAQWGALLAGSGLLSAALESLQLPAALLLGPMIAAIVVEISGGDIRVPRVFLYGCQAVIGCMIARVLTPDILGVFFRSWPLFIAVVLSIIAACSLIGWTMSRWRILPGTTAVWGLSPGAASAMVLMAGAFGADTRLVAFMQYLRVVLVATVATLVARLWVGSHGPTAALVWFPGLQRVALAQTLAVALVGGVIGRLSRIPAGVFLVPMVLGALLRAAGLVTMELPPWLLAASYALLGWSIGLGFTREILVHAVRALPQICLAILALIVFAAGLAVVLVKAFGVDPLTAYLATSPGGADSVAIIAASSRVDVSFVMALQTIRFVLVLMVGPAISRLVARQLQPRQPAAAAAPTAAPAPAKDETLAQVREHEGELD